MIQTAGFEVNSPGILSRSCRRFEICGHTVCENKIENTKRKTKDLRVIFCPSILCFSFGLLVLDLQDDIVIKYVFSF